MIISLLVSWKQAVSLRCSLNFLTLGRFSIITISPTPCRWRWLNLGLTGLWRLLLWMVGLQFQMIFGDSFCCWGNQCVHRFCGLIVFFSMVFCLRLWQFVRLGTLSLKDFCGKTPNISRLVLPMTALLGGFLGVAIILSLRRHALKLVEIAKYQELQKQGDIQDAVSNLNVLQCLGSQTSGFF